VRLCEKGMLRLRATGALALRRVAGSPVRRAFASWECAREEGLAGVEPPKLRTLCKRIGSREFALEASKGGVSDPSIMAHLHLDKAPEAFQCYHVSGFRTFRRTGQKVDVG